MFFSSFLAMSFGLLIWFGSPFLRYPIRWCLNILGALLVESLPQILVYVSREVLSPHSGITCEWRSVPNPAWLDQFPRSESQRGEEAGCQFANPAWSLFSLLVPLSVDEARSSRVHLRTWAHLRLGDHSEGSIVDPDHPDLVDPVILRSPSLQWINSFPWSSLHPSPRFLLLFLVPSPASLWSWFPCQFVVASLNN